MQADGNFSKSTNLPELFFKSGKLLSFLGINFNNKKQDELIVLNIQLKHNLMFIKINPFIMQNQALPQS